MEPLIPTMQNLFAQLGEDSEPAAIARFIEKNGYLSTRTKLHEASFWTMSQAAFLRDCICKDDNWAPVVDDLNAKLHRK